MESNTEYGSLEFCMEIIDFVWDYVYLDHGRDLYGFQTQGLLGFHPNPRFLESRVSKTLNGTR